MLRALKSLFKVPKSVKWFKEGYQSLQRGNYQKAIHAFGKSIHLEPKAEAYVNRASAHFKSQSYELALADYTQAIQLDPNQEDAYLGIGITYTRLERFLEAIQYYNEFLNLKPHNSIALSNRGYVHQQMKNYKKALKDYNKAIKTSPHNALAIYNRASVHYELGDYEAAKSDWLKAKNLGFEGANKMLSQYDLR